MSDLAREVVEGFGLSLATAEVAHLYPNDITRVRLNIRGQRGEAILGNTQWVLHEGDWVGCIGPIPKSRLWLIIAYFGSVNPGNWFTGDENVLPDLTTGQGPIPGFRPPIDGDSLWRQVVHPDLNDDLNARWILPRRAPGDEPTSVNDHYVRVLAGRPDGKYWPPDGYPASFGPFSVLGDRLQIGKSLPMSLLPRAYCVYGNTPAQSGATLVYKAGTLLNNKPAGPNEKLTTISGGVCDLGLSDRTTMEFGTHLLESQTEGFALALGFAIDPSVTTRLFRLQFAPILSDVFFCIGVFNGQIAVGIGREILFGMPYPYPAGGVVSAPNDTPSGATWYDITPFPINYNADITDRDGVKIDEKVYLYSEIYVSYRGANNAEWGDYSVLTVSDGLSGSGARQYKTYLASGQVFGGNVPQNLYGFGGDGRGDFVGPWTISYPEIDGVQREDKVYPLEDPLSPSPLRGRRGEWAWHMHVHPHDPIPDNPTEFYEDDPGDSLPDLAAVWLSPNYVMLLNGPVVKVGDYGDVAAGDLPKLRNPKPRHSELRDLDQGDDHPQYHNDARALTWLGGRTTADLPDAANRRYVTDANAALWDAAAAPTKADLTSLVNGQDGGFPTPGPFVAGSLKVILNSRYLRNGKDFHENATRTGFEMDIRTPVIAPVKDVLRIEYQPAT